LHRILKFALKFIGPRILRWLTQFYIPVGKRVVIMGARMHGCQSAEFLIKSGRKVTIVDEGPAEIIGEGLVEVIIKPSLLRWLEEKCVTFITGVKYEEITKKGLTITTKEGKRETIEADTIVTALPLKPTTDLLKSMEGSAKEIYAIGDCREPNLIIDAVADGMRTAINI
jgi:2,4-dienoyl-CoA reductase (NADPH2)